MTSFLNKMLKLKGLYEYNLLNQERGNLAEIVTREKLRLIDILIKEYGYDNNPSVWNEWKITRFNPKEFQ